MTQTPPAAVPPPPRVVCPVCSHSNSWPPAVPCERCGCDLPGPVAARIFDIDRQAYSLRTERVALVEQLRATVAARATWPPPPPPVPATPAAPATGLRAASAQSLLGLAGVGLLAVAAIVFTAVTWETLSANARVTVLILATGAAAWAARALTTRGLSSTGGAVGLLAAVLAAVAVGAAYRLDIGGLGAIHGAGAGSLAAFAACVIATLLSGRVPPPPGDTAVRGSEVVARISWGVAVSLSVVWALEPDRGDVLAPVGLLAIAAIRWGRVVLGRGVALEVFTVGWLLVVSVAGPIAVYAADAWVALLAAAATVAGAVVWRWLAGAVGRPVEGLFPAVATLTGLVLAVCARLIPEPHPFVAYAAVLAMSAVAVVSAIRPPDGQSAADHAARRPEAVRWVAVAATFPATAPALVLAATAVAAAFAALVARSLTPWRPLASVTVVIDPQGAEFGLAVLAGLVVIVAGAVAVWPESPHRAAVLAAMLLTIVAPAALWHAAAPDVTLWASTVVPALIILIGAWAMAARPVFVGLPAVLVAWSSAALLAATGWMAGRPEGTLLAGAVALAVARAPELVGARAGRSSLIGVGSRGVRLAVGTGAAAIVGASTAEILGADAVVVAVSAGLATTAATWPWHRRDAPAPAAVRAVIGVYAVIVLTALVASEFDAAAAASITAAVALAAIAVTWPGSWLAAASAWSAVVFATTAAALLLAEREVTVVEAYTAVPSVLLLGFGALRLARDPAARTAATLTPGLALALVPPGLLLLGDPAHLTRAVALALAGAVLLAVGVTGRLEAPTYAGTGAVAVVVLTQVWVAASALPRWVVFAALGLALVGLSATYERRLADLRRARERLHGFR